MARAETRRTAERRDQSLGRHDLIHARAHLDVDAEVAGRPERLELKLEAGTPSLTPQEPGKIKLNGRYLYGPPATGLAIEGEILGSAQLTLDDYRLHEIHDHLLRSLLRSTTIASAARSRCLTVSSRFPMPAPIVLGSRPHPPR